MTGHIETFTDNGIKMKDGTFVEADFIIGATGLTLQNNLPFGTIKVLKKKFVQYSFSKKRDNHTGTEGQYQSTTIHYDIIK